MKAVIFLFILILGASSFAYEACDQIALNGRDSISYQIYDDVLVEEFQSSSEVAALAAVDKLKAKILCQNGFEIVEVSCKDLVPNNPMSRMCYVEVKEGYFFVSVDMMDNVNIIFNRFD